MQSKPKRPGDLFFVVTFQSSRSPAPNSRKCRLITPEAATRGMTVPKRKSASKTISGYQLMSSNSLNLPTDLHQHHQERFPVDSLASLKSSSCSI